MLGVNMKKREMDDSYWLTLQKRLLDSGFITIVVSPSDGKNYYRPTPRGIRAYKTVLDLMFWDFVFLILIKLIKIQNLKFYI